MQSIIGKINFVKRCVLGFYEIVRPLQNMMRKNIDFNWNDLEKEAFENIKRLIVESLALMNPDFSQDVYLHTSAFDLYFAIFLT